MVIVIYNNNDALYLYYSLYYIVLLHNVITTTTHYPRMYFTIIKKQSYQGLFINIEYNGKAVTSSPSFFCGLLKPNNNTKVNPRERKNYWLQILFLNNVGLLEETK